MPTNTQPATTPKPSEDGFMLITVVVMVALVLIALSVAAPVVARDLRRDKEVESEQRANQYVRAIRLYQRKVKQYPPSIEALEKSNNVRYLRQQYIDPLTGKADWRIIHVGQNQTTVKGFFGEPLGGLATTGGGGGLGSAADLASGGTPGSTSKVGAVNGLAAGFGGATIGNDGTSGTSSSSTGTSAFGSGGGAGPIMGVATSRTGASLLTPNDQSTYDTWEFLYDPRIELMYAKGALTSGVGSQNASSFGNGLDGKPNSGPSVTPGVGTPGTPAAPGTPGTGGGSSGTTPNP